MRTLIANLRHFYQHRVLMLLGVYSLLLSFTLFRRADGEGGLAASMVSAFTLGFIVAAMQMDVVSKAFSFCLPFHRATVRRFTLLIGLVVCLTASSLLGRYGGPVGVSRDPPALTLSSIFSAVMVAYLIGFGVGVCIRFPLLIVIFMPLAGLAGALSDLHLRIESVIINAPVSAVGAAVVLGTLVWLWIGRPAWFRRRCVQRWIGFSDLDNRSKMNKYRCPRSPARIHPRVDGFFQSMIAAGAHSEWARHTWGGAYLAVLQIIQHWKRALLALLVTLALAGYVPPMTPFVVGVFIPAMTIGLLHPPVHSKSGVAAGRRERCSATIVLLAVLGSAAGIIVVCLVGVSHMVALLAPEIDVGDLTFTFRAINVRYVWLTIAVFPAMSIVHVLSCIVKPTLVTALGLLLGFLFVPCVMFLTPASPAHIIGAVAMLWALCFLVVYCIAARSDLVR